VLANAPSRSQTCVSFFNDSTNLISAFPLFSFLLKSGERSPWRPGFGGSPKRTCLGVGRLLAKAFGVGLGRAIWLVGLSQFGNDWVEHYYRLTDAAAWNRSRIKRKMFALKYEFSYNSR
jgi:hypothetical protein